MTNPTAPHAPSAPIGSSLRGWSGGRLEMLASSLFLLPMAFVGLAVFTILITGLGLATLWIGIPIAMGMVYFTRHLTDLHRLWFGRRFGIRITRPYRELPDAYGFTGHFKRFLALISDPQTWRDQAWLMVNATVGVTFQVTIIAVFAGGIGSLTMGLWWGLLPTDAEFHVFGIPGLMVVHDSTSAMTYGIPAGVLYLMLWWLVTPALMRAHLQIARGLLGTRVHDEQLSQRVERLNDMLAR